MMAAVNLSITASGVGGVLGIEKRFDLDRNIADLKVCLKIHRSKVRNEWLICDFAMIGSTIAFMWSGAAVSGIEHF